MTGVSRAPLTKAFEVDEQGCNYAAWIVDRKWGTILPENRKDVSGHRR